MNTVLTEVFRIGTRWAYTKLAAKADLVEQAKLVEIPIEGSGALHFWVVNGEFVRTNLFIDFVAGGHEKRYRFIPENEVWIDSGISEQERSVILIHELHERALMLRGMDYESAHAAANKVEDECRKNPAIVPGRLQVELVRNNTTQEK